MLSSGFETSSTGVWLLAKLANVFHDHGLEDWLLLGHSGEGGPHVRSLAYCLAREERPT